MGRSLQINMPVKKLIRNTNSFSLSSGQTGNNFYTYTPYTAPAGKTANVVFQSAYLKSDRHAANLSEWGTSYFVDYSASTEFKAFGWHYMNWSNNSINENVGFISAPWNYQETPNGVTTGYTSERYFENMNNMPVPRDLTAAENGQLPASWGNGGQNHQWVDNYNTNYANTWVPDVRFQKDVFVPSGASIKIFIGLTTNGGTHNIVNEFVFEIEERDEVT